MSESGESDRSAGPTLRWSVEQRVAFAARRLYWDGTINRDDLMRRFGVSANQATADLARLKDAYPDSFAYDTVARRYRAHARFLPHEADPTRLLRELRLIAEGHLDPQDSVLATVPALAIAELPERSVDAAVLRPVLVAIRDQQAIGARYVSFQRPGERHRVLSPHALVFDGFRWHVRAHDAGDDTFKDFVIARLSSVAPAGTWQRVPAGDAAWNRLVTLEIAPHPRLAPHQRRVIARDYGMDAKQRLRLKVREAVLFYVRRRFGLVEGHERRPAQEQHIVLLRIV
ncbi:MAG TPA: WYL domain-containing protein [Acetobacteraceae bacterium]|nr:WYL domain-containing protein [Acetobacteraceae bacterium]